VYMQELWKNKFNNVVKELKNRVIKNDCVRDYSICDVCLCAKARMEVEIEGGGNATNALCTECYWKYNRNTGLFLQYLYG
jgi:hypothetical protein